MKRSFLIVASYVIGIVAIFLLIELFSVSPRYEYQAARIINIQDDPEWGFIGEDKRTLVEWNDGSRGYVPGAIGEPNETIRTLRRNGVSSLFGIGLYSHSIFECGKGDKP